MPKVHVVGQGECDFDDQFSLLDALDDAGFDMPYSCRGGNCGACEVKLISGKVEAIQEPVFEVQDGHVLTCSIIPLEDIVIELV